MTIAYFDCFSGISGDMILGAMINAGLDFDHLCSELKKLGLNGYHLERRIVRKHEIKGVKVDVVIRTSEGVEVTESPGEDTPDHAHSHTHPHTHEHAHAHHTPDQVQEHAGHHLADLLDIIDRSALDARIRQRASTVFNHLAEAEGVIHGVSRENVHLHEVSGMDAMVDIVGACIGLDALGVEEVYASALPLGSGFIRCAHGRLPVPAPGALELLKGMPVYQNGAQGELVTPTGAAFLKTVTRAFGPMPAMTLRQVGYGAGTKDFPERPNMLRLCLGDRA
jgi:uncharacterized protein (TIGR00299 family) protein